LSPADAGAVAANPFTKQTAPIAPITEGTADPFAGGVGVAGSVPTSAPVSTGPRLVATMGTYSGQIFPLSGASAEIGRDAANAVALPNDTNASRRHATLQIGSGGAIVTDNGSSNGTFVNGVRIAAQTPTPLKPNDELTVGNTRFRFEA
jgi:pSer/pThr/pTyr-binding forkhead associated (FHA) protein